MFTLYCSLNICKAASLTHTHIILDSREIKPVNLKGNQPWIFTERTDTEAEVSIHGPLDGKSWLTGKEPDAGKDWGQEEKGMTEDEIVRWHHWLNGHEFEQTLRDSEGQKSLTCCSSWGCKESDMILKMNNKNNKMSLLLTKYVCLYMCIMVAVVGM